MRLTVTGLDVAEPPNRFKHLFGRYPYGFKPWKHCDQCLTARKETLIHPKMTDGQYPLQDRLLYLCGVGHQLSEKKHPELTRRQTNIHLAVYPRNGSIASLGSVYGVCFTIEDAQAIAIEVLPEPFQGLPRLHSTCKMFQFGYQMFNVDKVDLNPGEPVDQLRDEWKTIPAIHQDQRGRMSRLNPA